MQNKTLKIAFIAISIMLIIPSIIYLVQNGTVMEFETYYNFFINENANKIISTLIYLALFIVLFIIYIKIIKKKDTFKNIKEILIFVGIISIIYIIMLPWTSSDVFYYMGVGELDGVYNQNPYYVTMKDYYTQNEQNIQDEILQKGAESYWAGTTVVYGPIAQTIFKTLSTISLKNIDIGLLVYKLVNVIVHIANCYLIYKISNKKIFAIIYGLNPFILLEFIGMVHNDIIVVFFVLLALYFVLKKKNIFLSILFLAIATGIKYYTILLLPVVVLYHFRKEKTGKKFVKCLQYGILFILILTIEYIFYFRDANVLIAMMAQTEKYSKSIYSALLGIDTGIMKIVKTSMITIFVFFTIVYNLQFLISKQDKFSKMIRKSNITLILFIMILTTCQQWYLIWLFAIMMWQKPDIIRNLIGLSCIVEIANSIYMFLVESYKFDIYFWGIILILLLGWILCTNKKLKTSNYCEQK